MNKVKEIVNRAMVLRNSLLEPEAKALINSIGITTPSFDIANDSEEAVEIAKSIGYPVVLKVISPDIIHKTDVGGVILGQRMKNK
jgi:acetyl-CoA synthetase (ADP-forming)